MAGMVRSRRVAHPPPLSPFSFPFVQYCPKLAFRSCSEAWGGTLLRLSLFFMKTRLMISSTWRDLQWLWMFRWQWVWGLLPFQVFLGYPLGDLRVDLTQLSFMESPNRIAWHLMPWTIRFTFYVIVCRDGILAPSFLPHRTSPAAVALVNYRIVIKPCVVCSCIVCRCLSCCCSYLYVDVFFLLLLLLLLLPSL
jgi:hypothetical protein